jgi:pSer/pThr/pTyr-binding forkhead associated (FHA) protein/type II secretory pathway pseudopilin PulG
VKCELRIVSGARSGHRDVFDKSYIGIGRHPLSDVRFDAENDLDASTRHAAIVKTGTTFVLRDLGSTNGTYVNGEKLAGERTLNDGDSLRFGVHGPEVSFHILRDEGEVIMEAVHAPAPSGPAKEPAPTRRPEPPKAAAPAPAAAAPSGPSRTAVLRAEIHEQRSRYRALALTVIVVVLGAIAVVAWLGRTSRADQARAQRTVDSLAAELTQLRRLAAQTDSVKTSLESALRTERDPARIAQLRTRLTSVTARGVAIQQAQGVDYTAIKNANDRAVAIVYIRFPDSSMVTGTAFSVSTAGAMITNKHVVTSEHGQRAQDIAIQFSGSREILPARLVRVSPDADLAVLQLESQGPFPTILGLGAGPLADGSPIALIGFPGAVNPGAINHAKLVTGSVTHVTADSLYEIDSFSGAGGSGSPIFDRDGHVVGVEFGGLVSSGGSAILGLPIARAQALLPH